MAYKAIHNSNTTLGQLKLTLAKIIKMLPSQQKTQIIMNDVELIDSLNLSNEQISKSLRSCLTEITKKILIYNQNLLGQTNLKKMWSRVNYKFSHTWKHNDISLITDEIVKSNTSGYKFAIMEPGLQKGLQNQKNKSFTFRIKQCSSNWVAVGMCHKNLITSKSYGFNFGAIGHGGYLISANGGSWSNIKVEANNCVKGFKFIKNDLITCNANFETKKITFSKKQQKYEQQFDTIQGDQLYPCVLFYYANDEIQYLPNYKQ